MPSKRQSRRKKPVKGKKKKKKRVAKTKGDRFVAGVSAVDAYSDDRLLDELLGGGSRKSEAGSRRPLYPGPPAWVRDPKAFLAQLNAESGKQLFPPVTAMLLENFTKQREMDHRWRALVFLYEENEAEKRSFGEHKQIWAKAGWNLEMNGLSDDDVVENSLLMREGRHSLRPEYVEPTGEGQILYAKCEGCGKAAESTEPRECACGTHYCSQQCHAKDWPSHKRECDIVAENNEIAFLLTEIYWNRIEKKEQSEEGKEQLVKEFVPTEMPEMEGYIDYASEWKRFKDEYESHGKDELDFYLEVERVDLRKRLEDMQKQAMECVTLRSEVSQLKLKQHSERMLKEVLAQFRTMSTPLETDSMKRLMFKVMMFGVYENIFGQMGVDTRETKELLSAAAEDFGPFFHKKVPEYSGDFTAQNMVNFAKAKCDAITSAKHRGKGLPKRKQKRQKKSAATKKAFK